MFKNRATDRRTDGTTNRRNGFEKRPFLDSVGPNIRESWSFRHMFVYAETEWKWLRKSRYELGTLLWLLYSKKGNLSLQFYLCPFFQTLFEQTCSLKIWWLCLCTGPTDSTTTIAPPLSLTTHPLPLEVQKQDRIHNDISHLRVGRQSNANVMTFQCEFARHDRSTDRRRDGQMGGWMDRWTHDVNTLRKHMTWTQGRKGICRWFVGDLPLSTVPFVKRQHKWRKFLKIQA